VIVSCNNIAVHFLLTMWTKGKTHKDDPIEFQHAEECVETQSKITYRVTNQAEPFKYKSRYRHVINYDTSLNL
jgi:hypothetical protein